MAALLSVLVTSVVTNITFLNSAYTSQIEFFNVAEVKAGIEKYIDETNNIPSTLSDVYTYQGYEYLKPLSEYIQLQSGTITQSGYLPTYNRLVIATDIIGNLANSTFWTNNTCGAGTVQTASNWCGNNTVKWSKIETRSDYLDQISNERLKQQWLLSKFAEYYSANQKFPITKYDTSTISPGDSITLNSVVNNNSAYKTCSGIYNFETIPLDCNDLHNKWGNPIEYYYITSKHIVIMSKTKYQYNDGSYQYIINDLDFTNY